MSKHARTKLAPQSTRSADQRVRSKEELRLSEEKENPLLNELDMEIECPRCNGVMELHSSFDKLVYFCENCGFVLTGV